MDCYRAHIPDGITIAGFTSGGETAIVFPGEYLVHRLPLKVPAGEPAVLRFVGADASGRDVHVAPDRFQNLTAAHGVTIVPVHYQ